MLHLSAGEGNTHKLCFYLLKFCSTWAIKAGFAAGLCDWGNLSIEYGFLKLLQLVGFISFKKLLGWRSSWVLFYPGTREGLVCEHLAQTSSSWFPGLSLPTNGLAGTPLIFDVNVISIFLLTMLFFLWELKNYPQVGSEHTSSILQPELQTNSLNPLSVGEYPPVGR